MSDNVKPVYKRTWFIVIVVLLVLYVIGTIMGVNPKPNKPAPAYKNTLVFLKEKIEGSNKMELFSPVSTLDLADLKILCANKKKEYLDGTFYYLVVFDSAKNAQFPNSPFTAVYGMEDKKMIHIVAMYSYNRANGFSELTSWDSNMWEGKPKKSKI